MKFVDFSKTYKNGRSFFGDLMEQGVIAYQKNHSLFGKLMSNIENFFFFLIAAAKKQLDEEKIDRILESPDHGGQTVFSIACILSEKISGWILNRNIDVAFVDDKWLTPQFSFKSNVEKMLKKGINPFVVHYEEDSQFITYQIKFVKIDQKLLEPFITGEITKERTEAFYSFHDSECSEKCESSCKDKMLKFKLYTGKRTFENRKTGGEGFVSFGNWHGEPAAFKSLDLGKLKMPDSDKLEDGIANAEKTRAEFEVASKLKHENIVRVLHLFRYQETEKIGNVRSLHNWTVIVMDKHYKNIGELTSEERNYLPNLLNDVLGLVLKYI